MYRIRLNFAKSFILSCFKKFHCPVFEIKALKAEINGVLAGHSVAMATYCVTKIIPTCLPVTGQFFDTRIVASTDRVVIMTH